MNFLLIQPQNINFHSLVATSFFWRFCVKNKKLANEMQTNFLPYNTYIHIYIVGIKNSVEFFRNLGKCAVISVERKHTICTSGTTICAKNKTQIFF